MSSQYKIFIKDDLKRRILRKEEINLSQRILAKEYNTSTRPIGQAFEELLKEGYLTQLENGRVIVAKNLPKIKKSDNEIVQISPEQQKLDIEKAILKESFKGKICYLREEKIANYFNVGRGYIRNIFLHISSTGLLEHQKHKGWKLRAFNNKDLDDYLRVRISLECMALEQAKKELDKGVLESFLQINQNSKFEELVDIEGFHQYIINKADNMYIKNFFERHGSFFAYLFNWEGEMENMYKQTVEQHCNILESLINNKWKTAKELLTDHIWNNHNYLRETLMEHKNKNIVLPVDL